MKQHGIDPVAVCDANPELWGKTCEGVPILSYDEMQTKYNNYTILLTCVLENAISIRNYLLSRHESNLIVFFSNPYKVETKVLSLDELVENKGLLDESYSLLEDDESRKLFVNFLRWKMTGDITATAKKRNNCWLEVFDSDLILERPDYTYIDVGAYTGDSLIRFLAFCRGQYKKILCIEPDTTNFYELEKIVKNCRLQNVEIKNIGLWSTGAGKNFPFYSLNSETAYESSNFFRDVNISLSNNVYKKTEQGGNQFCSIYTLDESLRDFRENTLLLKIDTMGAEGEIVRGAKETLSESSPVLVMEYGTHSKYMSDLIPFIHENNSGYKFYLRQMYAYNNSRTFLYAIPREIYCCK